MSRLYPRPILSLTMLIIWLFVQMSVAPGHVLVGALFATIIPLVTTRFWPDAPRIRSHWKFARYMIVLLWDILVANLQVAWWILMPKSRLRPRFLFIPVELTHPMTITLLASTISLTPGTVSSHLSADHKLLIVHCLHTRDDEATIRHIKQRYERPLKEIFG